MQKIYKVLFLLIMSLFILSCQTAKQPPQKKSVTSEFSIKSVSWMVENLEPSIWNGSLKGKAQMFVSFFVSFSGNFDVYKASKVIVESPEDMWTLGPSDLEKITEIDEEKKIALIKRLQCGIGQGSVPLGKWKFTLIDINGNKYEYPMDINGFERKPSDKAPDENAGNSAITFIVPSASLKNEISSLSRPVIKSVTKDDNSIEIYFSVNDNRIKNGYFWFDVPGEKYYKDSGSMIDASGNPVNGCRAFSTDGKDCRYILRKDSENAEWFDKITACFFVVSDINRVASPWEERNRTVSAKAIMP